MKKTIIARICYSAAAAVLLGLLFWYGMSSDFSYTTDLGGGKVYSELLSGAGSENAGDNITVLPTPEIPSEIPENSSQTPPADELPPENPDEPSEPPKPPGSPDSSENPLPERLLHDTVYRAVGAEETEYSILFDTAVRTLQIYSVAADGTPLVLMSGAFDAVSADTLSAVVFFGEERIEFPIVVGRRAVELISVPISQILGAQNPLFPGRLTLYA